MEDSYDGRYQKLEKVGAGKYGIIYKVRRMSDQKQFIAKHVLLHTIQKQKALEQLKIIKKLKHLYIVQYIDCFVEKEDVLIIIMQYCGQRDLSYHIQQMKLKQKHFNQHLVVNWVLQLVLALQYIHSKKILHRDIKPQNIFIDKDMNLKVGDFGISKVLDQTQHGKTVIGTPFYLPPQICNQQKYSNKADIWSLGCVLYQICALQKPFNASKGIFNLMEQIKSAIIKPIPQIYSKSLNELVIKMLTRDFKKRPSAAQLLQDPILVQLMINNSSQINLKKEYPKTIDINQIKRTQGAQSKRKPITQSFVNRHSDLVNIQLKKFENQVKQKMNALKKRPQAKKDQIDEYYRQVKSKMKDIEKVVQAAFQQIKSRRTQNKEQSTRKLQNEEDGQCNSLMMSTIKTSNPLIKKNESSFGEQSDITLMSVSLHNSNIHKMKQPPKLFENNISISAESIMIDHSELQRIKSGTTNAKIPSDRKVSQSQSLDLTVKSQFQNTMNFSRKNELCQIPMKSIRGNQAISSQQLQEKSMKQLQLLQQTILKHPEALLDQTFMNCTLSISNDNTFLTNNLNNFKRKNQNPNKIEEIDESISFEFTKKQLPIGKHEEQASGQIKQLSLKSNKQQQEIEQYYEPDFQSYDDSFQNKIGIPTKKRLEQMNSVYSFYQQALNQLNNQSDMSETQQVRRKYPLNLSIIREHSNEGSMVTQNSTHSSFNPNSNITQNQEGNHQK